MFYNLLNFFDSLRVSQENLIQSLLPEPASSLLSGILLGAKNNLSADLREDLISTGMIHVVVVSGYNISLIAGIIASSERFLGKRWAFGLTFISICLYTLLTGAESPTVRSAVMGLIILFSKITGRVSNSIYILILTGVVMALLDSEVVKSISFQLSFLATLGILLLSDLLKSYFHIFPKVVAENLSITMGAQFFVFPLLVYYFGAVSIISPIVNLLTLWTIPLATVLGFALLAANLVSVVLAKIISWFLFVPLTIFYQIVINSAKLPFIKIYFPKNSFLMLVGMYLALIGFYLVLSKWRSKSLNGQIDKV